MLSLEYIKNRIAEGIPKGMVLAEHSEKGHFYRHVPTNLLLGSVTTKSSGILDNPHLKKWAARLAVEYIIEGMEKRALDHEPHYTEVAEMKDAAILVHQDEFEDAGGVGTQGHKVIEAYLNDWIEKGERPEKDITEYITVNDARLWAITRSAVMFMEDYYAIPIVSELLVANVKDKTQKYGGTLDGLMLVIMPQSPCPQKGRHVWVSRDKTNKRILNPFKMECSVCGLKAEYEFALTDWKTSNSIDKPDYAMQVSAYKKALTAMTRLKPKRCLIIRLDKKQAKYEVMEVLNPDKAYTAFKMIASVYDWLNDGELKLFPCNQKEIISLK